MASGFYNHLFKSRDSTFRFEEDSISHGMLPVDLIITTSGFLRISGEIKHGVKEGTPVECYMVVCANHQNGLEMFRGDIWLETFSNVPRKEKAKWWALRLSSGSRLTAMRINKLGNMLRQLSLPYVLCKHAQKYHLVVPVGSFGWRTVLKDHHILWIEAYNLKPLSVAEYIQGSIEENNPLWQVPAKRWYR